jgi:putative protease
LLRASDRPLIIAGPWLYTFNSRAWDFITGCGASYCISPFENSRQNLEKTFPRGSFPGNSFPKGNLVPNDPRKRSAVFVTIFARPSLFRIREDLGAFHGFDNFTGSRGEAFRLARSPAGTLVFPWEPFSIVDKIPFLREASFKRFILDFSSQPLKKAEYRDVMEAVQRASALPGTNRFNWKNGFLPA